MFHRENEVLRGGTGIAVEGATIEVYVTGTDTAGDYTNATRATIYPTNVVGVAIANATLLSDAKGHYEYYAPNGVYDEVLTYGAEVDVDAYIQMFDMLSFENDAAASAAAAAASAVAAAASANGAATSAAEAAASALAAANSADDAATSATAAGTARDGAVVAQLAAEVSANDASDSASAAAISETNAAASAAAAVAIASAIIGRMGFFFTTAPAASEVLGLYVVADAFTLPANLAGSRVSVGTNPTGTFDLDLQRNGASVATISIAATGVVTLTTAGGTAKAIAAGDVFKLVAPAGADGTVANVAITIKGAV